ncbi:4Fe-4S cluster-binding domain-containing protein [Halobacteriovorax sp. HLS]|uniref:4Fe-4S cluster-binding domain-containing protein n=1 Tax=Halobacteriovorax sp. HLS TaxID=2234000 RepID=UPI000FD83CFF|nr:4Fe-4S cluster-binding domain-containing protein [Halobacteriovorax sp. HLS]
MITRDNLQFYVRTAENCNLNCKHCFTSGRNGDPSVFNAENTSNYIQKIVKTFNVLNFRVVLHGGEPMLAPISELNCFIDQLQSIPQLNSIGIQTNLAYELSEEKLTFFNNHFKQYGIGTSWDADLRFGLVDFKSKTKVLKLWENNVRTLIENGHNLTLSICLSKYLIDHFEPRQLIEYAIDLGFQNILFERITEDGSAITNNSIRPLNLHLDRWLHKMFIQTLENQYEKRINNLFLGELATSYISKTHTANRCRNCELSLITIGAAGDLSGCPNSAKEVTWGYINEPISTPLSSSNRLNAICKEKIRNPICEQCDIREICNSDCYKLPWQDKICAAPKLIMKEMKRNNNINDYQRLL